MRHCWSNVVGFDGLTACWHGSYAPCRFEDKDVCHYYLAGMCPFEEFERTKHDVGPCPLAMGHDDDLRAEFEVRRSSVCSFPYGHAGLSCEQPSDEGCLQKLRPEEKDRLGFERELLKYIEKLMLELSTKVRRNEERLAKENVPVIAIDDQVCAFFDSSMSFPGV